MGRPLIHLDDMLRELLHQNKEWGHGSRAVLVEYQRIDWNDQNTKVGQHVHMWRLTRGAFCLGKVFCYELTPNVRDCYRTVCEEVGRIAALAYTGEQSPCPYTYVDRDPRSERSE